VETEIEDQFFAAGETRKPFFFFDNWWARVQARLDGRQRRGLTPLFMNQSIGSNSTKLYNITSL
jgi:hypothetical protein